MLMQLQKVKAEIAEASNNPQGLLLEALHSAGFSGALANPLVAPESAVNRLNSSILEEFVAVRPVSSILFILSFICRIGPISNFLMSLLVCSEQYRKTTLLPEWYLQHLV